MKANASRVRPKYMCPGYNDTLKMNNMKLKIKANIPTLMTYPTV